METWEQTKNRIKKSVGLFVEDISQARYDAPAPPQRFNIHKRSLPVGLDKIVVIQVTKEEAAWWIEHKLKTKENEAREGNSVIYFDIIPVGADRKQRGVFFNSRPVTKEE